MIKKFWKSHSGFRFVKFSCTRRSHFGHAECIGISHYIKQIDLPQQTCGGIPALDLYMRRYNTEKIHLLSSWRLEINKIISPTWKYCTIDIFKMECLMHTLISSRWYCTKWQLIEEDFIPGNNWILFINLNSFEEQWKYPRICHLIILYGTILLHRQTPTHRLHIACRTCWCSPTAFNGSNFRPVFYALRSNLKAHWIKTWK